MASKVAMANGDDRTGKRQEPGALAEFFGNVKGTWEGFTRFLSDVRAEMRKVVAPSRKEVQVTTTVVIIAVFIFGVYFMVADWVFRIGVNGLLNKLGGMQ